MLGCRPVPANRRVHRAPLLAGLTALVLFGCSDVPQGADDAAIAIQTSQLAVRVENKVGTALTDVEVAIVPIGRATEFTRFIGRMESAEKKDVALGAFYGRDGTAFSLRVIRPKIVRVTGKDLNAKRYTIERNWE